MKRIYLIALGILLMFGISNVYAQGIANGRYEPVECAIKATVVQAFIINGDNFTMVMPMVGTAMSLKYKYTNGTLTLTDNGQTASLPCSYDKATEMLVYSGAVCKKTSSKAEYNGVEEQKIAQENLQKYMAGCKEIQPPTPPPPSQNNTFDRNNIQYVYIINESEAVTTFGHNFIAFEDVNGNGSVYSYGPVISKPNYPARMWLGTFSKDTFSKGLSNGSFYLLAKRIRATQFLDGWIYDTNDEYSYGNDTQKFDRYIKIEIDVVNGKKMINAADDYLHKHPEYGVFVIGKAIGQCDNMTSEIAGAGGKGYKVLSWPNWSFENIASSWKLSIHYVK